MSKSTSGPFFCRVRHATSPTAPSPDGSALTTNWKAGVGAWKSASSHFLNLKISVYKIAPPLGSETLQPIKHLGHPHRIKS